MPFEGLVAFILHFVGFVMLNMTYVWLSLQQSYNLAMGSFY